MTTDQILFGVGLILVPAVGSQVLASRLRIPAHPSPRDKLSPANSPVRGHPRPAGTWPGGEGVVAPARVPDGAHTTAIGLTGDPVNIGIRSGAMTHRNDHRPASSHRGTRSSNWR